MNLQELIQTHHDPNLVKPDEAPNGNIQTLVFNDGEIMTTKGGDAFLQRSFFSQVPKLNNVNINMPVKHGDYSFAIVLNLETAKLIRSKMENNNNKNN